MTSSSISDGWRLWCLPLVCASMLGAALTLSGRPLLFVLVFTAGFAYLALGVLAISRPLILVLMLLLSLEVLPPVYIGAFGETPLYPSFFLLPIALAVFILRLPDIRLAWDPVACGLAAFLIGTALSIPFAFWLSGTSTGVSSLSRWILLAHTGLIFCLIRGFAHEQSDEAQRRMYVLLFAGAILSAIYGIVDFLWPLPIAHPAADQFIWLEGAVLRRAQGPFYESSNFGNFCGFFLIAGAVAFFARKERDLGLPRTVLVSFISVLSLAVLVAFSRSIWASILAALLASLMLSRSSRLPRIAGVVGAVLIPLWLVWMFWPGLWDYLVSARLGRLWQLLDDPNYATSGRFDTWVRVVTIMRDHPEYLFLGIGYKTLPVTRLFHGEIVTDNGYLSLLLETGIAGLAGFALFSSAILRVCLRLARSTRGVPSFWATVLFSIWCGELVLLLAADALTYWRNMAIFVGLVALTLNLSEGRERSSGSP